MGAYNFKDRFRPLIESGGKTHTIRGKRRHPDKPGNRLYLYTGLRTKRCRIIREVLCTQIEEIQILEPPSPDGLVRVILGGVELDESEKQSLARRDGFACFDEMVSFWRTPKNRIPFDGHVIHWRLQREVPE
jgi:hypothetical protein